MKAILLIRENATGIIRSQDYEWDEDPGFEEYKWSDGYAGCDCVRGQYFAEMAGEKDPARECGESAYSVQIVDHATGNILYADYDCEDEIWLEITVR